MKISLLLTFLTIPILIFGQITNHFENMDTKWNVAKTYPNGNMQNPNFVATTTTVYGLIGDTIINSNLWFKIYSTSDSLFQNNLMFKGLIRSENNRVLFLDTSNQLDTLYDFNISAGDSVLFNLYGQYPEKIPVVSIDSIQLNGQYYKRFHFAEPTTINAFDLLSEIWIEGIGSIHGPLFTNFPIKFSTEMPDSMLVTCTFSNNQQVWQHQNYSSCFVNIVLSADYLKLTDFKIYPNPFSDIIHLDNFGSQLYELTLLNSLGQTIMRTQVIGNNQTMDLTELKSGIYFLSINNGLNAKTIKIIKNF